MKLRPRLTFANVVSCLALFVALGGSAYAATQLKKNSVGSKQIKKNAVTGAKIKNGAIEGPKIKIATLGKVPSAGFADNAGAVGGTALSGLLSSDHLLTGHNSDSTANGVIFSDPRTGLKVVSNLKGLGNGDLGLVNTNSSDSIWVEGIGFAIGQTAETTEFTIEPGEEVPFAFSAYTFTYGVFAAQRISADAQTVAFTCLNPKNELSCVGMG